MLIGKPCTFSVFK